MKSNGVGVVDVLALIQCWIMDLKASGKPYVAEQAAYAAVAELVSANKKIVAEWEHMAKHGYCRHGVLGTGQTFDCWAVDLCETALASFGGDS